MSEVLAIRGSFPLKRQTRFLTQINQLDDGTEYRFAEQTKRLCQWDFDLRNAPRERAAELEDFFRRVRGRYGIFAFLDPLENLLKWSEDFTQAVWEKSNPIAARLDGQTPDPAGGEGGQRWSNTATEALSFTQWLAIPSAGLELTASLWAKAASPQQIAVFITADGGETFQASLDLTTTWRRCSLGTLFPESGAGTRVGFQIEVPQAGSVDLFGAQLMALPCPGDYTKTTDASGCHLKCRFATDALETKYAHPGASTTRVSIVELM